MKKIRHSKDIHHEKLRLRVQQLEQEKALRLGWQELKHDLQPGNLLRSKLEALSEKEKGDGHWLSGLLHYGTSYAGRMAGTKIESALLQGMEVLREKWKRKKRR